VFRALSSAPGSGALTITFPGSQSNATWIVSQWSGVDVSGTNGAGAIVQIASARGDAVSTLSKTLAAFANAQDVAYGVVAAGLNGPAVTPGSGFTEIAELTSGENTLLEAEQGVNLTNVSATFTAANNAGLLAFEIKAGSGGGGVFAAQSTVSASPTSIPAGTGTSTITVTAKDGAGNPVSGATVVLSATGSANTITQPSGPTNASGVATGTLSSTAAETKTVSATANGIPITQTATVTVTPVAGTIAHTLLTSGTSAANQTVYTTASIAPAANALITVAVLGIRSGGAITPTLTGGGMSTWTQVASVDYGTITTPLARITVFRALSSAPGSGPLTITYSSSQSNATWIVSQWTGVEVTGVNGAGAIVQIASARGDAVSTLSKTLAAFANINDVAYAVVGASLNGPAVTPGSGFTEIAEPTSGESSLLESERGVNLTNVAASFTAANNAGLLAFELKAGGGVGGGVFATQSTVAASPTSVPVGTGTSTITVTAKDAGGNPVSGATVVLAATGGGNTLTQPSSPTNASGVATGTLSSTVAETKTISATANGIAITQTASVTFTAASGSITHTLLTSGTNTANQSVYTTASITPAANALITVAVLGRRSTGAQTPTVTGGGMSTWTQVASVDYDVISTPLSRVTVFRALSTSPGSGTLTITFPNSQSNATWIVSQWSGVDVSGVNGAGAIVQSATARGDGVTSLSATLSAFGNSTNAAYGVVGAGLNGPAVTPGSGFTEIAEPSSGESNTLEAEWAVNLTNVSASWGSAKNAGLLGIEIKAAGGSGQPPLEPSPIDPTVATTLGTTTEFLYTGSNPVQTGVAPGTIVPERAAVLRGKVLASDGQPLSGVGVTILGHSEFGSTVNRADGMFDMVVNGGGLLTVEYAKAGYLRAQRSVDVPWQDYSLIDDVVLVALDPAVTMIDFSSPIQVARGGVASDLDGTRQATLLFSQGTQATMVLADGSTQPLSTLAVRATEFTIGPTGTQAMPAELPPTSAYTYAVEYSVDSALAVGAREVQFSQPVFTYVENFLSIPVGLDVPAAYYDRRLGQWVSAMDGRVIKILGITAGRADLDVTGSGQVSDPATLALLGVTDDERTQLALLYGPGQTLWRVPITHFTSYDYNYPYTAGPDAPPPPPGGPQKPKSPDDPNCKKSSIIECETQVLREQIAITGTPFSLNYTARRVAGYRAGRALRIPLSGPTVSAGLKRIILSVEVAGKSVVDTFPAAANQTAEFTWDGTDAYGRTVPGVVVATIRIGYLYRAVYTEPAAFAEAFAVPSGVAVEPIGGGEGSTIAVRNGSDTASQGILISRQFRTTLGPWLSSPSAGIGAWTLSVHHGYDPVDRTIHLGDGTQRSAANLALVIQTVAGSGAGGCITCDLGEGVPATQGIVGSPFGVAAAPDGGFYVADQLWGRVRRVGPDGVMTTFAGSGNSGGFSGDGGPATAAKLSQPTGIALGPDGTLYIADFGNQRVRRVAPDGVITTGAGTGTFGFNGDDRLATTAQLSNPVAVAVGPDGSLYIADQGSHRIRRVSLSGMIQTVAGDGTQCFLGQLPQSQHGAICGNGVPATQAKLRFPTGVAIGPDGSLFIADGYGRVRRVGLDGIITTVAGNGDVSNGDGGPAIGAGLGNLNAIAVDAAGVIYIAEGGSTDTVHSVRGIGVDGIITTVAGTGTLGFGGDGGPAPQALLNQPSGVAINADGTLRVTDLSNHRVRGIIPALPGLGTGDVLLASADGGQLYVFDEAGRHQRTLGTVVRDTLYQFAYDTGGRLSSVVDMNGDTTKIDRDGGGAPTSILAPYGQRTTLSVTADGYLASVANPAGELFTLSYAPEGLLSVLTDPRSHTSSFGYDSLGRLVSDSNAAGGVVHLATTRADSVTEVTFQSALGRTTTYRIEPMSAGGTRSVATDPAGLTTTSLTDFAGRTTTVVPTGDSVWLANRPDPRWGLQSPTVESLTVRTPGGLRATLREREQVTLSDPNDPLSLTSWVDSVSLNGHWTIAAYSAATRRLQVTTAEGRQQFVTFDAQGRIAAAQIAGIDSVRFEYDSRGRLSLQQVGGRIRTYAYDSRGRLLSSLDPLGRRDSLFYDDADRLTRRVPPDGRTVLFDYDPNGNLASLTPPGRPEHGFQYTAVDLERQYDPPGIPGPKPTLSFYNLDRQLDSIVRPDSIAIRFGYDAAGRTGSVTFDRGTLTFGYSPSSGNLVGMRAPTGDSLTFSYDGSLPIEVRWVGNVNGRVGVTYDNNFRVADQTVNGANAVSFGYDRDGLLTSAGALRLGLNALNGLLVADTLGAVLGSYQYTSHGELKGHGVTNDGAALFATGYARDSLGRIVQLFDTTQGVPMRWSFVYDTVGRLAADSVNSAIFHAFTYDANGNRLSFTSSNGTINYTYDDQDRLLSAGTTSYTYGSNGELKTKTVPGVGTTTYTYDALGNLVIVLLPDGTRIDYVIDGQNRRVGKKMNGVLQMGWLWHSQLAPVGELNGSGALVSRFVYATHINVPDYMVKDGQTYRMVLDHLGSVRLVVNVADGTVAQRLDYDEFGRVTLNTNPGFQPFGYAGGLSDDQTALVRFGRRDYDPTSGRWTTKDPILFGGGEENLYVYVGNDPLTWSDPAGLKLYDKCKVADFLKRLLATLPHHNWYPGGIRNDGLFNPHWPDQFDPKATDLNDPTHNKRFHDYYEVDGTWLRSDRFGNFAAGYALQRLYGAIGSLGAHGGGMRYARQGKTEHDPYSESLLDLESWSDIDLGADYGFRDAGWGLGMNARFGLPYDPRKLTDPCGCGN